MSNIRCPDCGLQINPNANTHNCQPIGSTINLEIGKKDAGILMTREWLTRLVTLVDKVAQEDDEVLKHSWFSHLLGYVHSLDEFLK